MTDQLSGCKTAVVTEDHPLVADGLASALGRHGLLVVGTALSGEEGIRVCRGLRPDVVTVDLRLPDMDGLELISRLSAECRDTAVVVVTADASPANVAGATLAGACAVLDKTERPEVLVSTICAAAAWPRLHSSPARPLPAPATDTSAACQAIAVAHLTERRRELLRLLAAGLSNKEIAREIGSTEGAVMNHVSRLMAQLGARSRAHLAALGAQCAPWFLPAPPAEPPTTSMSGGA